MSKAFGREHIVLRLFLVGGFRAQELFALRWNDIDAQQCRIMVDEAIDENADLKVTKTEESTDGFRFPPGRWKNWSYGGSLAATQRRTNLYFRTHAVESGGPRTTYGASYDRSGERPASTISLPGDPSDGWDLHRR
jgi:integrase